jgi:uncharacterized protein YxjI
LLSYPLSVSFRRVSFTRQASVADTGGRLLFYVRQKAFTLRERVTVFLDEAQTRPAYSIVADRVIDFSSTHAISDASGAPVGAVQRRGMASLWRAHYEITRGGAARFTIREANPWIKVLDGLMGEVPILGAFTGYVFNPAYVVSDASGTPVLRVTKQPAFFESRFEVTRTGAVAEGDEELALLGAFVMLLHERRRG